MIPYGKQEISESDIDAVISVLRSDFLTQGPKVPEFERALSAYTGAKHTIVLNSATSALHISCLALGLSSSDWLWTSPISFVASANCALYCGAKVDFVDIDPVTFNMSPYALEKKLAEAKALGKLPKVVIPVHLSGRPCDMKTIYRLSKEYGFSIIEDASHAIGAKYLGEPVGTCRYSDITIFSFHPVKIITTAEGGAALTNSKAIATKLELLRSHGITRDESMMTEDSHGSWYYQQIDLGFNFRMTELQAALGINQMARVDEFVLKRNVLAERYDSLLNGLPVTTSPLSDEVYSSFHLYILKLNNARVTRREIFDRLRSNGIGVNVHYIPIHLQPYYRRLGFSTGDFPFSEDYYRNAISIPLFSGMTFEEQDLVVSALARALEE